MTNPIHAWIEPGFPELMRLDDRPETYESLGLRADLDLQQSLLLIEILRCQSPVRYDFGDLKVSNSKKGVFFEFRLTGNTSGWWRVEIPLPCLDDFLSHLDGLTQEMQPRANPLPWHLARESYEQWALECARDLLRAKKLKVSEMEMDRYFSQLTKALRPLKEEEFDSWLHSVQTHPKAQAAYMCAQLAFGENIEDWEYAGAWGRGYPVDIAVEQYVQHYRRLCKGDC